MAGREPSQAVEHGQGEGLAGVQGAGAGVFVVARPVRASSEEGGAVRAAARGAVGEPAGPVGAVRLQSAGGPVGGLVGHQGVQGAEGRLQRREVLAAHGTRVEVGHGAGEERGAEAVHGDVVEADVPVVEPWAEPQQREVVGRCFEAVDGGHVVGHVPLRRRDGVVGSGEVHPVQPVGFGRRADHPLADGPVLGDERGVQAVAEVGHPVERGGK